MRNVNKVFLIGNVTRDPEAKKMANGETICTFGLATNREWVTTDGRQDRSTEFHEIVCFGGLAHVCELRVRRGELLNIEGYVKTRSWDDSDGLKRFRTEVVVEELIVLTKRPKEENYNRQDSSGQTQESQEMNPMNVESAQAESSIF